MRQSVLPWLVFFLIFFLPYTVYATPDDKKNDLGQLRDRIENLQQDLANKEESRSELSDNLHEATQAINEINLELDNLTSERDNVKIVLSQLQKELDITLYKISEQQTHISKLLYKQYLGGQQDYFRLLLSQKDPNHIFRELYYYGYITNARTENIFLLRDDLKKLQRNVDEINKKNTEIILIQKKQAEKKEFLEQEEIKYKKQIVKLSKEVKKGKNRIRKLRNDEKRLSVLVKKIGSHKKYGRKINGNKSSGTLSERKDFEKLKGQLNLPIKGEITNSFGSPRSNGGVTWKGLFIRASAGMDVKAIAHGQVVFADWLRGFGNILILDHGNDYMSLYGNNEILAKKVGETIQGGDTIAIVGNSSSNLSSGLYFELRHKGKPFDPLKWIRLK